MPDLIGFQDGINATEINLKALDPAHQAGYDKVADTWRALKDGHNEVWKDGGLEARVAAAEAKLAALPFPYRGSSTSPGA